MEEGFKLPAKKDDLYFRVPKKNLIVDALVKHQVPIVSMAALKDLATAWLASVMNDMTPEKREALRKEREEQEERERAIEQRKKEDADLVQKTKDAITADLVAKAAQGGQVASNEALRLLLDKHAQSEQSRVQTLAAAESGNNILHLVFVCAQSSDLINATTRSLATRH